MNAQPDKSATNAVPGDAIAAGMIAFGVLTFLVEFGIVPRESAIELVDSSMLKIEMLRAVIPVAVADRATHQLDTLLKQLRGDTTPPPV